MNKKFNNLSTQSVRISYRPIFQLVGFGYQLNFSATIFTQLKAVLDLGLFF